MQPPAQPQWEDAHADPPTEPIPVVSGGSSDAVSNDTSDHGSGDVPDDMSEAATQQWTMEPPPPVDVHAESGSDSDVDADAPTQQWTMEPPPAEHAPPPGPPPSGPPPEPPHERSHEPPPPPPPDDSGRWIKATVAVVLVGLLVGGGYLFLRSNNSGDDSGSSSPTAAPPTAAAPTTEPVRGCDYPAQVLDLTGWNLTVPTLGDAKQDDDEGEKSDEEKAADKAAGKDAEKKAKEINQPELATFVAKPFFQVAPTCDSVAFRAPVNGITTSGSKYPRSELREMTPDGSKPASWSSSVGAHTFTVNEAFTALPQGKPNLVGVQIHDEDDDVSTFRLEGSSLYITEGDDTHHKLVTDKYVLGTKFEAKYIVSGDVIQAFYNGQLQTTISKQFVDAYFKAGAYTQANCDDYQVQCNNSSYGETTIYSVQVEHS